MIARLLKMQAINRPVNGNRTVLFMKAGLGWSGLRFFSELRAPASLRCRGHRNALLPPSFKVIPGNRAEGRINMVSNWKRNFLAAAVVLAATTATASAQDISLKVNVPFSFSINQSASLTAGNYILARHANVWRFTSADYSHNVPIVNYVTNDHDGGYTNPTLTFVCAGSECELHAIHLADGRNGVEVPGRDLSKSAGELAVVNVPVGAGHGD